MVAIGIATRRPVKCVHCTIRALRNPFFIVLFHFSYAALLIPCRRRRHDPVKIAFRPKYAREGLVVPVKCSDAGPASRWRHDAAAGRSSPWTDPIHYPVGPHWPDRRLRRYAPPPLQHWSPTAKQPAHWNRHRFRTARVAANTRIWAARRSVNGWIRRFAALGTGGGWCG